MSKSILDIVTLQREWFHSSERSNDISSRKQRLSLLQDWIVSHEQDIVDAAKLDLGKGIVETRLMEIKPILTEIRHAKKHLKEWVSSETVGAPLALLTTHSHVQRDPKGVCLIIGPWNFPFTLLLSPLVHAIAAGNTIILKPSEIASNSASLIAHMVHECFEEREVTTILGDAETTQSILQNHLDHVFFTGSPAIGRKILEASIKNLNTVTLELGGANPAIVDSSANIKDAAKKIVWGKFLNFGQICMAPNYLLVHESIYHQFYKELRTQIKAEIEDPLGRSSRIINNHHLDRLKKLLSLYEEKHTTESFPHRLSNDNALYLPVSLIEVNDLNEPLLQDESFGPIVPIVKYSDINDLINFLNTKESPLIAYLFTRSRKSRQLFVKQMRAGNITINDTILNFGHPDLPFGGFGNSGSGRGHGVYGFDEFSNIKSVLRQRVGLTTVDLVSRPFTPLKIWISKILSRWF